MEVNDKLTKQISETKYLTQENSYRYRPIMRFFYTKYEQAEYWLYKEDVYEEVKKIVDDYDITECERDLEFLTSNMSLSRLQDTKNVNTLNEFKYHNFRYQMTDYAVTIERMTIELENMEVKVSSLEPRLFERINKLINKILNIKSMSDEDIYELWFDLTNDFRNLNEQYQDFLKDYNESRTEELLKLDHFLEFKNKIKNYLELFIKSYITNSSIIKDNIKKITQEDLNYLFESLIRHQKEIPQIKGDFNYDKYNELNKGKWNSIVKWFIGTNTISEGDRLLEATEKIIKLIYSCAKTIMELRGNMINRKEEYKQVALLFDGLNDLSDAKKLSSVVFGVQRVKHYKGTSLLTTDSLVKSYSTEPQEINVESNIKEYKTKLASMPIKDKTEEKRKLLEQKHQSDLKRREKIHKLIESGLINLVSEINLDLEERRYVLKLIENYKGTKTKETEFGLLYDIENKDEVCKIISPDGIFTTKGKIIKIEVQP